MILFELYEFKFLYNQYWKPVQPYRQDWYFKLADQVWFSGTPEEHAVFMGHLFTTGSKLLEYPCRIHEHDGHRYCMYPTIREYAILVIPRS